MTDEITNRLPPLSSLYMAFLAPLLLDPIHVAPFPCSSSHQFRKGQSNENWPMPQTWLTIILKNLHKACQYYNLYFHEIYTVAHIYMPYLAIMPHHHLSKITTISTTVIIQKDALFLLSWFSHWKFEHASTIDPSIMSTHLLETRVHVQDGILLMICNGKLATNWPWNEKNNYELTWHSGCPTLSGNTPLNLAAAAAWNCVRPNQAQKLTMKNEISCTRKDAENSNTLEERNQQDKRNKSSVQFKQMNSLCTPVSYDPLYR